MDNNDFYDMGFAFDEIQSPLAIAPSLQPDTTPVIQQEDLISFSDPAFSMFSQYALYIIQNCKKDQRKSNPQAEQNRSREKERLNGRMANFNPKDNVVWKEITVRFGANIKQPELLSIAKALAANANISLDRDAKRRKSVLIKWFEENWAVVKPHLDYVILEDCK